MTALPPARGEAGSCGSALADWARGEWGRGLSSAPSPGRGDAEED